MVFSVGSFGFLAHPLLRTVNPQNTTGNYGIQDTRLGLQWVKDNIAAFGGNPNDVTIGGTSAGGGAVCMHLVSPLSAGLFHKAVIESGFCTNIPLPFATGYARAEVVMNTLGCNTGTDAEKLACLYAAPAASIVAATTTRDSNPTQDYYELMDTPINLVRQNKFNRVPLLIGNTLNESTIAWCAQPEQTPERFAANIRTSYPNNATLILEAYTLDLFPTANSARAAIDGDFSFTCPAKSFEDAYSEKVAETYVFHYNHAPRYPSPGGSVECMGAGHTFNIYFLFPSYYTYRMVVPQDPSTPLWTPEETVMANRMRTAWINFIKTGVPTLDPSQGIVWPQYTFAEGRFMAIDFDFYVGTHYHNAFCPAFAIPSPDLSCEESISIQQTETNSWVSNSVRYFQQSVSVTTGALPLYAAELVIRFPGSDVQVGAVLQSFWGVTRNEQGLFKINDWRLESGKAVPPHTTLTFGYISSGSAAIVSVGVTSCVKPALNCEVSASLNLQSSYTSNGRFFQVYNFLFANQGPANTESVSVKLDLPTGAYPTQAWNLQTSQSQEQVIATGTVTYTAPVWGLGAQQSSSSSGFILSSPVANAPAPAFTVLSSQCA